MALIVLDASVVIGALDDREAHHERAWSALMAGIGSYLVLPATALSEILVGVQRGGPVALKIFEEFRRQMVVRTEPVTEAVARTAAELRIRHSSLRLLDALVLATGEELGADAVLTADRRWKKVSKRVRVV